MIPKFRAFDVETNQIKEVMFLDLLRKTAWFDADEEAIGYDFETCKLMQSTGLKDKNGKEIFEGDIVKALSEGYCGTFQVVWRNEGTPMYILYPAWQNEQFWDLKGVNGVDDGIEVIGNVHEHPELLENI